MPNAQINVLAGHPRPALRQAVANVAAALSTVLDTSPDRIAVWVNEIDPELWLINGKPAAEVLDDWPRAEVEMPFVHVSLIEGRPKNLLMHLNREITDGIAHALGTNPDRIRVVVHLVMDDLWSIGGVPASVVRAEEAAARRRATS